MTTEEAIKVLKDHNIWRRGTDTEMTNPTKLGIAIDIVIEELENSLELLGKTSNGN